MRIYIDEEMICLGCGKEESVMVSLSDDEDELPFCESCVDKMKHAFDRFRAPTAEMPVEKVPMKRSTRKRASKTKSTIPAPAGPLKK